MIEIFNPLAPEFRADPYHIYRRFRAQHPIYCASPFDSEAPRLWYFFRYAEVVATLKDARFGRAIQANGGGAALPTVPASRQPFYEMSARWMLYRDPPDHTRLRSLVSKAFTPRMVAKLQPQISRFADVLLDNAQESGSLELITEFASLLPVAGITELLGLPLDDLTRFKQWSSDLAAAIDHSPTSEVYERASQATLAISSYLCEVITARRKHPQDDFISGLIVAEGTGGKLSQDEIIATCILLLGAGQETTIDLIGNSVLALLQHPDQLALLRTHALSVQSAIEELLRYDSPVQMTARVALEDVAIGGQTIRRGEKVTLMLGAANRDPEAFFDPDRLDLARKSEMHTSFGLGIHFCLGAPLARATARIALSTLLRRFPRLHLATDTPQWREGPVFRGLQSLPLAFAD